MKKSRLLLFIFSAILLSSVCLSVSANVAQTTWSGVSSTGLVCQDENSPVEVRNEVLTFELPSYPSPYFNSEEDVNDYASRFIAEYTFYNPSEYTVNAQLFFPFGRWPEYFPDPSYTTEGSLYDDPEKFQVLLDGVPVERTIRHTLDTYEFDLETSLKQLQMQYMEDEIFHPDTPVIHYTYVVEGDPEEDLWGSVIRFTVPPEEESWIYCPQQNELMIRDDGSGEAYCTLTEEHTLDLFTVGKPLDQLPVLELLDKEGNPREEQMIQASVETATLQEKIMAGWDENSGILKTDWYNAALSSLIQAKDYAHTRGLFPMMSFCQNDLEDHLMCWYSYEITLLPGQEAVHTVIAPCYPDIDMSSSVEVYNYTYLLSPARTWNSFGPLDLKIKTPYSLRESSLEGWEEEEEGYSLHLEGLPDSELTFSLSASRETVQESSEPVPSLIIAVFVTVAVILGGIVWRKLK